MSVNTAAGVLSKSAFAKFVVAGSLFQFFATLMQATAATYFSNYMTDTALIPAAAASLIMVIACVWDLIADPVLGGIMERTESRWGRYRPYVLLSAPVLTVLSFLLFYNVNGLPLTWRIIYLLVIYMFFGTAITLFSVPANALITSTVGDMEQRNKSFMFAGIGIGASFTVASTWSGDIAHWLGSDAYYCWNMLLYGVPLCIAAVFFFRVSRESFVAKQERAPLRDSLKAALRHRPVWSCITIWAVASLSYGLMFSSSVYYIKYYIATDMSQWALIGTYMFVISMGALVSMVVFQPLFLKLFHYDHNKALMLSQGLTLVLYVVLLFFGRTSFTFLCVVSFIATACTSMTQALQNAYVGDAIDYVQLKEGQTLGAVITSLKTFCGKLGSATASYSVLAMLALTGYVENVVGEGQSAAAMAGINFFRFGLPALCCIVVLIVALCYPIRKYYGEIRTMKEQMHIGE